MEGKRGYNDWSNLNYYFRIYLIILVSLILFFSVETKSVSSVSEDCTKIGDEDIDGSSDCADLDCRYLQCMEDNPYQRCWDDSAVCNVAYASKSDKQSMYGNLKWRLPSTLSQNKYVKSREINENSPTLISHTLYLGEVNPDIDEDCNNDDIKLESTPMKYTTWGYIKTEMDNLPLSYRVDDRFKMELKDLKNVVIASATSGQVASKKDLPTTLIPKQGKIKQGWYQLVVTYEDDGGNDCLRINLDGINLDDIFLAMDSRGPLLLDGEISKEVCEEAFPEKLKGISREWNDDTPKEYKCCGDDGYKDSGYVFLKGNKEIVCAVDDDGNGKWSVAESVGILAGAGYTTHSTNNQGKYYTDILSNDMPNNNECNSVQITDNYYSYSGSNKGWIACDPGIDTDSKTTLGEFKIQTEKICNNPNPHIRKVNERVKLNSGFVSSQPQDKGGNVDSIGVTAKPIPLIESDYSEFKGDNTQTCKSQKPKGGTLCQRGKESCSGVVMKSSDTNTDFLCCEGNCDTVGVGIGSNNLLPEFMCINRNNIGFWAGCGSNLQDKPSHNFYPGGLLTTFKDFGTTVYGDGKKELKPGSTYIFNNVLALGVNTLGANIYHEWSYDIKPDKYGDAEFIYDWGNYDKLTFFFKALRKPMSYYIHLKAMKNNECSLLIRLPIFNYISEYPLKENKWYKAEVPLDKYLNKEEKKNICGFRIETTQEELKDINNDISFPILDTTKKFFDVVFVDRFTLSSQETEDNYCAFIDTGNDLKQDTISWITTLDSPQVCNEQPGYIWINKKCCGDDPTESYTAAEGENFVCYKGTPVPSGEFVWSYEDSAYLLSYNGGLYSCGSTPKSNIVTKADECKYFPNTNYYCGRWGFENIDRLGLTATGDDTTLISNKKTPSSTGNLIKNGGFESDMESYWVLSSQGGIERVINNKNSGKYSLHINKKDVNIAQRISIQPNKDYSLSFFMKGECGLNTFVDIYKNSKITKTLPIQIQTSNYKDFTQVSTQFRVSDQADSYMFRFVCSQDNPNLYIDDIKIIGEISEEQSSSCCPKEKCWNGGECVPKYSRIYEGTPEHNQICLINDAVADWVNVGKKFNPDGSKFGYSTKAEECFFGNNDQVIPSEICLKHGDFVDTLEMTKETPPKPIINTKGDNYCENIQGYGVWSSRTKQLASKLLEFADGKLPYTLFCDIPSLALNNHGEMGGNVKKVCVLKYNDKEVAVGGIVNIEDTGKKERNALDDAFKVKEKDNTITINCMYGDEGNQLVDSFDKCKSESFGNGITGKLFYNNKLKAFIFDKKNLIEGGIFKIITDFIDFLIKLTRDDKADDTLKQQLAEQNFDRVYVYSDGSKSIVGYIKKEAGSNKINVEYKGFTIPDICSMDEITTKINEEIIFPISQGGCKKDFADDVTKVEITLQIYNDRINTLWQDLTSKLRPNKS